MHVFLKIQIPSYIIIISIAVLALIVISIILAVISGQLQSKKKVTTAYEEVNNIMNKNKKINYNMLISFIKEELGERASIRELSGKGKKMIKKYLNLWEEYVPNYITLHQQVFKNKQTNLQILFKDENDKVKYIWKHPFKASKCITFMTKMDLMLETLKLLNELPTFFNNGVIGDAPTYTVDDKSVTYKFK